MKPLWALPLSSQVFSSSICTKVMSCYTWIGSSTRMTESLVLPWSCFWLWLRRWVILSSFGVLRSSLTYIGPHVVSGHNLLTDMQPLSIWMSCIHSSELLFCFVWYVPISILLRVVSHLTRASKLPFPFFFHFGKTGGCFPTSCRSAFLQGIYNTWHRVCA